jgi:hypothetical protein
MKQNTKDHAPANAKSKVKGKAGEKANEPGLQGDEKIGGKVKANTGQAG